MKVLVTGASGFLGKNLLLHCRNDWEITAGYFQNTKFPSWLKTQGFNNVSPVCCDLLEEKEVRKSFSGVFDLIVHFAANGDPRFAEQNPVRDLELNTVTTVHLLKNVSFKRFVYPSSGAVYHGLQGRVDPSAPVRPDLAYAISNLASEQYIQAMVGDREFAIIRFFGAYGPYEPARKMYTKLVQAFGIEKKKTFPIMGDGKNLIGAMFVRDAMEIFKRIGERPIHSPIVDVGIDDPVSIIELARTAARTFGVEDPHLPCSGAVPEHIEFHMDPAPLKQYYDFTPKTSLQEGLKVLHQFLVAES